MDGRLIIAIAIIALIPLLYKLLIVSINNINSVKGTHIDKGKKNINSEVLKEVIDLSGSIDKSVKTVKALSEVINKEIETRVGVVTQELSKKYEAAIKEKELQYKTMDEKFKKTVVEKKQTESVIRSLAEGLVVLNDKGEVLMMNPAAEKLLDVSKESQIGKGLSGCLTDQQVVSLAKSKGEGDDREIELNAKNEDTKKVIRSSTAVIENESGQTIGMVSVLTDVTKQKELDRMKAHFVASVSHELRTPIVAIRNSVGIMLSKASGALTTDQEKFLTIADRNLVRLNDLINDLLDLSKLEARKMEIHPQPSSIEKVIGDTCDTLTSWAKTKGITLAKNVASGIPMVNFDGARIIQVLTNLVGNAIKFTPKNGLIVIEARISPDKKDLFVSVNDNGIGISKEDLPKLFNKFSQVGGRGSSPEISGTGLGLALSKEFVTLHGGTIWAESSPGKGTKMIFKLPAT